jgi:uncharacterized membrane protein
VETSSHPDDQTHDERAGSRMNGSGDTTAQTPTDDAFARGLVFLGYGLLILGLPTAGTSALLALVLAYARRDGAGPLIGSHHRFQIRIFWIDFALGAAATILGAAAFADAAWSSLPRPDLPLPPRGQLVALTPLAAGLWPVDIQVFHYSFGGPVRWPVRALLEAWGSAALFAMACLWSLGAPLYGALRLASGRPMGHSAE